MLGIWVCKAGDVDKMTHSHQFQRKINLSPSLWLDNNASRWSKHFPQSMLPVLILYCSLAGCVYNSNPSSNDQFLLSPDSTRRQTLIEDWVLVSTCHMTLGQPFSSSSEHLHKAGAKNTEEGAESLSPLSVLVITATVVVLDPGVPTVDPMWVLTQPG